ncbi:MAG: FtsX-like permease family protein [Nitrospiraceae bacterium]|nr:FtsX-like permease family protein [Nitrospiraceae bacterium]
MELIVLAIKDIFRRKGKSLYLLVAIVIPVAILSTILLTFDNADSSLSNLASKFGFTLIVQPKNVRVDRINQIGVNTEEYIPEGVVREIEKRVREIILNPKDRIITVVRFYKDEKVLAGKYEVSSVVAGVDFKSELEAKPSWTLTDGRWPTSDREAVLGGTYASSRKISLNDTVTINGSEFKVAGILQNYNSSEDYMVFAPFAEVQKLFDKTGFVSVINIQNVSLDKDKKLLQAAVEDINRNIPNITALSPQQFSTMKYTLLKKTLKFLLAIVVATVAVSIFSIFNIMTSVLYSRVKEIGLLKSVGASRSQLLTIFLSEYLTIGLIGGMIGYPLGLFMTYLLDSFLLKLGTGVRVNLLYVLVALLVGVFCSFAASSYPIYRLSRIKITESFRTQWEG